MNNSGIMQKYMAADKKKRANLMIDNYSTFDELISIDEKGIIYRIKQAMARNSKYKAELTGLDIFDSCYDDIDGIEELRHDVYVLKMMRMDYDVMEKQVAALRPKERKLIERIYRNGDTLEEIAKEEGTNYNTISKRVKRARERLRDNMLDFWDRFQVYGF